MNRGNFSRRGFIQSSVAALGAAGLPGWFARDTLAAAQANDATRKDDTPIRIGCIGVGSPQSRGLAITTMLALRMFIKSALWAVATSMPITSVER